MTHGSTARNMLTVVSLLACVALIDGLTLAADDETVAFNTKTLKYHCLSCEWAQKCTRNCITISRAEAIKRGGVPCKVCGGTCNKGTSAQDQLQLSQAAWRYSASCSTACF